MRKKTGEIKVLALILSAVIALTSCTSPPASTAETGSVSDVTTAKEVSDSDKKNIGVTRLSTVENVKIIRYSTTSLKVQWSELDKAKCYKVYRAEEEKGKYKLVRTTTATYFRDTGLKKNTTYYYKVKACAMETDSAQDSELSPAQKMQAAEYSRTTILAGDSIMTGMAKNVYNGQKYMDIGGKKKVVAEKGLGTHTFRTKGALDEVLEAKPYRVYLMLGMNEISYRSIESMINDYEIIIKTIQEKLPDTDIVLLPVSPVSKARKDEFKQIGSYNKQVKELAQECGVKYYDYTSVLKDEDGYLKYNGGDGIHWSASGYKIVAKKLAAFDKAQDE